MAFRSLFGSGGGAFANEQPGAPPSAFANAEVGIGVSDGVLLGVSLVGFCLLATTVYSIVVLKFSNDKDETALDDHDLSYDDYLLRTDVQKLSRAERRARAKAIMKQQRRLPRPQVPRQDPNNDNEGLLVGPEELDVDHGDDAVHSAGNLRSRKERQMRAKALERQERLKYQQERQQEQYEQEQLAKQAKYQKQREMEREQLRQRQERQAHQEQQERERQLAYDTFLSTSVKSQAVDDFCRQVQQQRIVDLQEIAESFKTDNDRVVKRIRELLDEQRLTGMLLVEERQSNTAVSATKSTAETDVDSNFPANTKTDDATTKNDRSRFVYVSKEELKRFATEIQLRGQVNSKDVADILTKEILKG